MRIDQLPDNKHKRYFMAAFEAALLCPGQGRNLFRLGSVLVYKKNIYRSKFNTGKTHPKLVKFARFPFTHAESATILAQGMDYCEGFSIYTVRILHNNEIALAKPCKACYALLNHVGIKKIYYTTDYGYEQCQ